MTTATAQSFANIAFVKMVLMIAVGVLGAILHVNTNLIDQGTIVGERFLRGAPILAPLLFANMGTLGLIVLLDPSERPKDERRD